MIKKVKCLIKLLKILNGVIIYSEMSSQEGAGTPKIDKQDPNKTDKARNDQQIDYIKLLRNETDEAVPVPKASRNAILMKLNQVSSLFVTGLLMKTIISPFDRVKVLQ